MTVAIKESLTLMHEVLKDLETNATQAQEKVKAMEAQAANAPAKSGSKKSPPDLFSVPGGQDVDAKALASRLDGAIAKVEKLLKEEA